MKWLIASIGIFILILLTLVPNPVIAGQEEFAFEVSPKEVENDKSFYIFVGSNISNESYRIVFTHSRMNLDRWNMRFQLDDQGRYNMVKEFSPDMEYGTLDICVYSMNETNNSACQTIKLIYSDEWRSYLDAYNRWLIRMDAIKAREQLLSDIFWDRVVLLVFAVGLPLYLVARLHHKTAREQHKASFIDRLFTRRRPHINPAKLHLAFSKESHVGDKLAQWEFHKKELEAVLKEYEKGLEELDEALDGHEETYKELEQLDKKIDREYRARGLA